VPGESQLEMDRRLTLAYCEVNKELEEVRRTRGCNVMHATAETSTVALSVNTNAEKSTLFNR